MSLKKLAAISTKARFVLVTVIIAALVSGCGTGNVIKVKPSSDVHYPFIEEDGTLRQYYRSYNTSAVNNDQYEVALHISEPNNYKISFHGSSTGIIDATDRVYQMPEGLYPFTLKSLAEENTKYVGAVFVMNVDENVTLATFGKSDETVMFPKKLLEDVDKGILAIHDQTLDNSSVYRYWLGNRDDLYVGGVPEIELDFSPMEDLKVLRIDNKTSKERVQHLTVYPSRNWKNHHRSVIQQAKDNVTPVIQLELATYRLNMEMNDGTKFKGYIRNLHHNVFTTFMKVPCKIPGSLIASAKEGTVARYTVYSSGQSTNDPVAEIVFGLDENGK